MGSVKNQSFWHLWGGVTCLIVHMLWERCWLLPFKNHGDTSDFHQRKWHHGHHGHRKKKNMTHLIPLSWFVEHVEQNLGLLILILVSLWSSLDLPDLPDLSGECACKRMPRWWFQTFFIFIPISGRFPFWLVFFRSGETTNQMICVWWTFFVYLTLCDILLGRTVSKKDDQSLLLRFLWILRVHENYCSIFVIQLLPQPKSGMYIYIYL